MASMTNRRTMTTTLLGPTAEEMATFIQGAVPSARINVRTDPGYNQMDPGGHTFSIEIGNAS